MRINRRNFVKTVSGGVVASAMTGFPKSLTAQESDRSDIFHVYDIPENPFLKAGSGNLHTGIEAMLSLMDSQGLKFYRSDQESFRTGPQGMIAADDVVLIKVNAQWKHRGCTNSDLIRGLIQRILDHPDGFSGEAIIIENGQDRGSLNCDTEPAYGDRNVYANALNRSHTFLYLVNTVFNDPRVSAYLLDPIGRTFISQDDHSTDGYRKLENVSYPCFTSDGGNRVELKEGIWDGSAHKNNLKLINVPVLKHHDTGGSEITASVKHFYGILSMKDGWSSPRHYDILGETCGKMIVSVSPPVLNIMDAIWVSHSALKGYPEYRTFQANQIAASQDPVALDYWTAKHILYPYDNNTRHHPEYAGNQKWLTQARDIINNRGGLKDLQKGIQVDEVTKNENKMRIFSRTTKTYEISGQVTHGDSGEALSGVVLKGLPGDPETDTSGQYQIRVLNGWTGTVIPEKAGFSFYPEKRSYRNLNSKKTNQDFIGTQTISAPINFSGKRVMNRSLFFTEQIIVLNWTANPANATYNISHYRIYEATGGIHTFLVELDNSTFEHMLRDIQGPNPRTYEIVAVYDGAKESLPASTTV